MSDEAGPEPAAGTAAFGTKSMLRTVGAAVLVLMLVLLGVAIGTHFGPHVMKVEQRVVGPVRLAAYSRNDLQAMPDIVAQSCPAVVLLRTTGAATPAAPPSKTRKPKRKARKGPATPPPLAIGFFLSPDGYLLTSASALPKDPVEAVLSDGRVMPATRVAADPLSDLALLKVDGDDLATLQFADDAFPRIGQTALVVAPAPSLGCVARTLFMSGDFMGDGEGLRAYLLSQGALDVDWSGVPVLDIKGEIVGIAGLAPAGDPGAPIAALLPGSTASHVVDRLLRDGSAPKNSYGFEAEDIGPTLASRLGADRGRGAVVSLIEANSAADKAGLKAGDIVVGIADRPVSGASELARLLDDQQSAVALQIQRRGAPQTVNLPAVE